MNKSQMEPSVYEVGYMGEGKHRSKTKGLLTPAYKSWRNMLQRCYSQKWQKTHPTYSKCSVVDDWHNFQTFADWHEAAYRPNAKHIQLDKDWVIPSNKTYAPAACVFIPQAFNALLLDSAAIRGALPQGVTRQKKGYRAKLRKEGEQHSLGTYRSIAEAELAYLVAKREWVEFKVCQWIDKVLSNGIAPLSYIGQIKLGLDRQIDLLDQKITKAKPY